MHISKIPELKKRLKGPLPGWEAHLKMSSVGYRERMRPDDNALQAAVLALLIPDENDALQLVYIKRPNNNPNDKHSGQISFPGGKHEADETLEFTALRECHEEIGIEPDNIEIIGKLTPLFVFVSNYNVSPYVGIMSSYPTMKKQETEVDEILTIGMRELQDQLPQRKNITISKRGTLKDVPYYDVNGHTLWGVTAMITAELLMMTNEIQG